MFDKKKINIEKGMEIAGSLRYVDFDKTMRAIFLFLESQIARLSITRQITWQKRLNPESRSVKSSGTR